MPSSAVARTSIPVLLVLCSLLTGCIPYPVHKTLQPEASVVVVTDSGAPIAGADVLLIASAYPYGRERSREAARTDAEGRAWFPAKREWRTEAMVMHGSETYFWDWCIRADGYQTLSTANRNAKEFDSTLVARLDPGESTSCPPPPPQLRR